MKTYSYSGTLDATTNSAKYIALDGTGDKIDVLEFIVKGISKYSPFTNTSYIEFTAGSMGGSQAVANSVSFTAVPSTSGTIAYDYALVDISNTHFTQYQYGLTTTALSADLTDAGNNVQISITSGVSPSTLYSLVYRKLNYGEYEYSYIGKIPGGETEFLDPGPIPHNTHINANIYQPGITSGNLLFPLGTTFKKTERLELSNRAIGFPIIVNGLSYFASEAVEVYLSYTRY